MRKPEYSFRSATGKEIHVRKPTPKFVQDGRKYFVGSRGYESETQPTNLATTDPLDHSGGLFQLDEDVTGSLQEHIPGVYQPDAPSRPVEGQNSELILELLYLIAKRWLRNTRPFGRASEVKLLGGDHEVAQPPQIHRRIIHFECNK